MNCKGFPPEHYDLFALGTLEPEEGRKIEAHLAMKCPVCTEAIENSLQFWCAYSIAAAGPLETPSAGLRGRVLNSAKEAQQPAAAPGYRASGHKWQLLAAAALLLICAAAAWYGGYRFAARRSSLQRATRTTSPAGAPPPNLVRQLNDRLAEAQRTISEMRTTASGLSSRLAQTNAVLRDLRAKDAANRKAMDALRAQIDVSRRDTTATQSRLTDLQAELVQNRALIARAESAREQAENSARTAAEQQASLLRRVRELSDKNQELEQQLGQLRQVLQQERKQAEPLLQLAGIAGSPSVRVFHLRGTTVDPNAAATGFLVEGSKLIVVGSNLTPLRADRIYQLWVIRTRRPGIVSGGVFKAEPDRRIFVHFEVPALLTDVSALAITEEPASGSQLPTGEKLLIGTRT